jgi:polyisoprenoid-binding protein YceI
MRKIGILVLAMAFISMSFVNRATEDDGELSVDVVSSKITWQGYKPAGSHIGTINLKSGSLEVKGDKIKGGSFSVDMSTIKESKENARVVKHLKSADFFEIETFPTSTFEITNSKKKDGKTIVTGDLTIKGITKEISFPVSMADDGNTLTLTSETFQVNRAEFNVKFKSKSFFNDLKDNFIEDNFDLQVTIVANK